VLENSQRSLIEIGDQGDRRINIEKVVVGYFFAVQLFKYLFEITVECPFLMGILSITELFTVIMRQTECRVFFSIKIVEYG